MRETFNPPLCDEDCNHCSLLRNKNGRMVTRILNDLVKEFGNKAYQIIQHRCPNMTDAMPARDYDSMSHIVHRPQVQLCVTDRSCIRQVEYV